MGGSNQIGNFSIGTIGTSFSMTAVVTGTNDAMMLVVKDGYKLLQKPLKPIMPAEAFNQAIVEHDMGSSYSLNSIRCIYYTVYCIVKRNLTNGNSAGFLKIDVLDFMGSITVFDLAIDNCCSYVANKKDTNYLMVVP